MSVPFHIGENSISLAMANEIVLAYSERRQAISQSAVNPIVGSTDPRDKTIWLEMQTWLESYCTSFIDHVNGPLNPAGTDFLYFTVATWRTVAGLNASGFYRRDSNNKETYGKIEAQDYRIKRNFTELQNGFSALKWTAKTITVSDQAYKSVISSKASDDPTGYTDIAAAFVTETWVDGIEPSGLLGEYGIASHIDNYYPVGTGPDTWNMNRGRGKVVIPSLPLSATEYIIYLNLRDYRDNPTYEPFAHYLEDDGMGTDRGLYLLETVSGETPLPYTTAYINNKDTAISLGSYFPDVFMRSWILSGIYALVKWSFTNS